MSGPCPQSVTVWSYCSTKNFSGVTPVVRARRLRR